MRLVSEVSQVGRCRAVKDAVAAEVDEALDPSVIEELQAQAATAARRAVTAAMDALDEEEPADEEPQALTLARIESMLTGPMEYHVQLADDREHPCLLGTWDSFPFVIEIPEGHEGWLLVSGDWEEPVGEGMRRMRVNIAESPLLVLARRRDANGQPFLDPGLVAAGERLREDFELAQMGPRITQNWDRFMTAGIDSSPHAGGRHGGG